jgi:hypothetical protein
VFLRFDPLAFGVESEPEQPQTVRAAVHPTTRLRTGLTEAVATDAIDDTYDLGWLRDLPADPDEAVAKLRKLLVADRHPVGRHFIYQQMENILYKVRASRASALTEFDQVCRDHDSEMETIRSAFMAKWGVVPWLETYRQMCIRLQKDGNHADALRWAERGLAVYGANAARAEAVEDLTERAEHYRAELGLKAREVRKTTTRVKPPKPSH